MTDRPLLKVDDLVVRIGTHEGTVHAVNGVSFEVQAGETLGLVGESGCGKSVTSLAVMRLLPKPAGRIERGQVVFAGQDLARLPEGAMRDVRGKEIAMIFQDPMTSLNPVLTVDEQMVETIRAHRNVTATEARTRAAELLGMVGIPRPESRLRNYPHQFSGGMRQRVMFAMALALEPKLMIADEPTTALDVTIQAQVLDLLRRLTDESGTAVILITHDLGVVAGMTQRVNVMYAGFIVETATTEDLFARPSHPYTVGLLHSIPRIDDARPSPLVPIEGAPPNQHRPPIGCPFAPRCAWRIPVCWREMPALDAVEPGADVIASGPRATHRAACHNPPTADEAVAGKPVRPGFAAAAPPGPGIPRAGAERPGRSDTTPVGQQDEGGVQP
jgi:oligopeptide/dipeptide ABC transporter ATP-binding protein